MNTTWKIRGRYLAGTLLLAFLAGVVPVFAAFHIAKNVCLSNQSKKLEAIATDVARRANQTGEQLEMVHAELSSGRYGAHGSETDIQRMRGLTLTSTYLQAVGRMEGTKVLCTSMGVLNPPVDLGPPDLTTIRDVDIWLDVQPSFAGKASFHALEMDGVVVFVTKDLVLDVYTDQPNLSVAVVAGESNMVLTQRGQIESEAAGMLGDRKFASFVYGSQALALHRGDTMDVIGFVSQPLSDAYAEVGQLATLFVPFGGLVGLLLSLLILREARRQHTLPFILRAAVKKRELFLNYQPVVDLETGKVVGAEALIRWRRMTGEMIRPDLFIPAAEECGLITEITEQVINQAFAASHELSARFPGTYVAINVTSTDVRTGALEAKLRSAAERHAVDLRLIGLEITESGVLDDQNVPAELEKLSKLGVRLAMDDFGTGFSNISYLMKLDIDCLKIDKLFVDAIGTESATSSVVDHMVEMAKTLEKYVIAEGIESQEQADYLRKLGVQAGQGYYFGKPMPLEDLMHLMSLSSRFPEAVA